MSNPVTSEYQLPTTPSSDGDLSMWLSRQGIGVASHEQTAHTPPEKPSVRLTSVPDSREPGSEPPTYETRFLSRRQAGPVRPTHMIHVSERVHRFFTFLAGYTQAAGARLSIPDLLENLISDHLLDHEEAIERLKQEFLRQNLNAF